MGSAADRKMTGADVVTIAKQALHSGFVFAVNGKVSDPQPTCVALVIRGASRKDVRPAFDHLVVASGGATPPQVVKKEGRTLVAFNNAGSTWACWNEKGADMVFALSRPESADVVIETLDGKRPNAIEHPIRAELAKIGPDQFQPVGVAFVDMASIMAGAAAKKDQSYAEMSKLGFDGMKRVDYRWGFQGDALMSFARIQAPSPRRGIFALYDQPTFDKATLPPLPADVDGFMVISIDLLKVIDQLDALAKAANPAAGAPLADVEKSFHDTTGLKLREDLLAHLGPKLVFYNAPGKPITPKAGNNPFGGMIAEVPKLTFLAETASPGALIKTFDALVTAANRELKKRPANRPQAGPGAAKAETPAAEIKAMPGSVKTYVFSIPALAMFLPDVKPTVMIGKKYVVFSLASDSAKQAIDSESQANGHLAANGPLAKAVESVPSKLMFLTLTDPRDTMAKELNEMVKSLPAMLQAFSAGSAQGQNAMGAMLGARMMGGMGPAQPRAMGPGGAPPGGGDQAQIKIDQSKIPSADVFKKLLFPRSVAMTVDDQGARIEIREAFPDLASSGVTAGLVLPAIQSARAAAQRAAGQQAGASVAAPSPGAAPPAPGSAPPGGRPGRGRGGPQTGGGPQQSQPGGGGNRPTGPQ